MFFGMANFAYLLLASALAVNVMAFPFENFIGDEIKGFEKKFAEGLSLSVRMITEKVLQYEAKQGLSDLNIPALAKSLGLTTLVKLVEKAGLASTLAGKGPFTVFGPTNKAFSNIPEWAQGFLKNKTILTNVLLFHVVPTSFPSSSLKDEQLVSTVLKDKKLRVNIYSDAGPNPVTVVTAQCAPIDLSRVDQKASNGLIHVLNSVMIPPLGNIVESLVACPVFKTLVTALKVAQLFDTFAGDGPFTVFAPTDTAFSALPPGVLDKLLKNVTALQQVLEYHAVPLTYCSAGLATGLYNQITTFAKQNITIQVSPDGVKVNNANVIVPDGSVTNGVVHAIDAVLIPPGFKY